MSTLESIFWHILGYAAIPVIVITGFVISSLIFFYLQKIFTHGGDE
jgi:uncharacterized protein (TIGR02808 family)